MTGARLWNSLPHDIVASDTLSHFRRGLKTFLADRTNGRAIGTLLRPSVVVVFNVMYCG